VAVFALEQTEGEELPEPCTRLAGEDPLGAFAELVRVAATLGFAVEEHVFADETNGDCAHALHRIRVRADLAPAHRECYAFCTSPVRPAILSTVRADGRPHAAPIWYALDGRDFLFTTGRGAVKGRNLRRDPRLALCIQDERPPFAYVRVEGTAEVEDELARVRVWAERIGGRYMGADRAREYGARNGMPGEMLVRVRIEHNRRGQRRRPLAVRDRAPGCRPERLLERDH
jgi:PPOX class probable F420-dependent enzyme